MTERMIAMNLPQVRRRVLSTALAAVLILSLARAAGECDASGATSFAFSSSGITVSAVWM